MKAPNGLAVFLLPLLLACSQTDTQDTIDAYLFTYFTGNGPGQESIHYALSPDGFHYRALNNNEPIISSDSISSSGGVRDPHLLRGKDGETFYMVATDLHVPDMGWSNQAIVLMKSDDLIHWSSSVVNIPENFPEFSNVQRVWAPQTIFDEETGKYMIYFSMLQPGSYDKIYYAYANEDFTGLEAAPRQLLYDPTETPSIDADIVEKDGTYHLFFKTDAEGKGIAHAISDSLTGGYKVQPGFVDQTDAAVEGSGTFKLNNSGSYILMYDMYTSGSYQFTKSTGLNNFSVIDNDISMNFHPRHGSVLPITDEEAERLLRKWGTPKTEEILGVRSGAIKKRNVVIDQDNREVYLPLKPDAVMTSLDPEFVTLPGAEMTPQSARDFTDGPVNYTVTVPGQEERTYGVTASVDHNPVLNGYYADPEIIYSQKTGKYYLYPTSDGFHGWSGTYFKTFSSNDLVRWKDEGVILDLEKDVQWTSRNAWAPTIAEKKIDGEYKYFYYFTAAQKIGVAVADQPTGPFRDSGQPLIAGKPEGVRGGQEIDPDVFTDPATGRSYLYWGNGYMAMAELNDNMTTIDRSTTKVMTPDATYREGTEVFYRDGIYYFLWSENDTRSEDYRVRYAVADAPDGELEIPDDNLVIAKKPEQGIYGTGHNSVIQVPGTDQWFIVYHRFTRPEGITMGDAAGYHREVCIDRLEFNEDGTIKRVTPTLKGIDPVK